MLKAAQFVEAVQDRQGFYISCIEEIAWRMGFITKDQMLQAAEKVRKSTYGEYIFAIAARNEAL
jgi:glucose-1-phosphate thymidylyltransferase